MTEIRPSAMPRPVTALLGFVAGCVDGVTFLGLFGIFVAQLTGSYVLAGTNFVQSEHGLTVKLLAIPVFFLAGCIATAVAAVARLRGLRALPCVMGLECALLSAFTAIVLLRALPGIDASAVRSAALLGLAAMGVQSAMVRLLMHSPASTNVMTTNSTQIAIDCTLLLVKSVSKSGAHPFREAASSGERLSGALPVVAAFLFGTVFGASAFSLVGFKAVLVPLAVTYLLLMWMILRPSDLTASPLSC